MIHMATKNNIFEEKLGEYLSADIPRKSEILSAVIEITGLHRKSAIRRFRRLQLLDGSLPERRGRKVYYTKDVDVALFDLWEAANQPCGELLFPLIEEYVSILKRDDMWTHGDVATSKLCAMKKRTVRRRCELFQRKYGTGKGKSSTKPSHLKSIIPIFKGPWKDLPPGNGQLDTVAHCGDTLIGDFVFSLNYIDAMTYWIVLRAQWNKGAQATAGSMVSVKKRLPVPLVQIHPDTGSEFINWVLKKWCDENGIEMTRSEPGKSNDNMYVEERNGHVVRKYLGYTRFDCKEVVPIINELYEVLGLYLNHFQVVRRTLSKERVGAKYKRTYETTGKTPYQRMMEHPDVSKEVKKILTKEHERLNPLVLKKKIDSIIKKIMRKQRDYDILK